MELFVARQPIFDLHGRLEAYELLYRGGAQSVRADGISTEQMSRDVIIQAFLDIGLDRLTAGKPAFLNFSREMLLSGCYDLLDRDAIVVELLEDVVADADVITACERMIGAGYRLALDDYVAGGNHEPLLQHAEIVKIDVLNRPTAELRELVHPLRERGLSLVAERVETAEVRDECHALGFELFQGYFFSRPEMVSKRGISVDQLSIMQLMNLLHDDGSSDHEVEEAFRRDPSLSYKLLRMVNAAAHGGRGIESISHAIQLLGRGALHRWLALLLVSSLASRGGAKTELVRAAILRARLCELMARAAHRRGMAGPLFLVGLFSLMDALLGTSMEEIVERIDVTAELRAALLHEGGPYADWLRLAEAYEAGEWAEISTLSARLGLRPHEVSDLYLQSLSWAGDQVP